MGTEARLGLKPLWVWLQSWVLWVQARRCVHTEVMAGASALAGVGGGCEGWLAACPGKTHFFPSCPPEAPSVRVEVGGVEGRRERICFGWQGEASWLLLEQLRVGSESFWGREGLVRGGLVFSEAGD